jgi:DNA-binding CsgD family transcriptional regulator
VASRARVVAEGAETTSAIARARVRAPSGRWLLVRGSTLGEHTAVIIEPARMHELAPLIADGFGLTVRERAVTQLVAQGLATSAIGDRLHISPWTVQDHLKSIFEKVGVSTRGELVARVFFEHRAPPLTDGAPSI